MRRVLYSMCLFGVALFAGCAKPSDAPLTETDSTATPAVQEAAMSPEIQAEMAKLSEEDRALAMKQKDCPVSGEPLGSMGVPIKVDVKGQPVFICCEGCRETLLADADKYLAKLPK